MEFLTEDNVAGQSLLRLVSRGNAIIAELLRLSDNIPPVFKLQDKNSQRKYSVILFDFKYFKQGEYYEAKIGDSAELLELDTEFKENHIEILKRFYNLFESIYKYSKDFRHFLMELEEGVFIQLTLVNILHNEDGKQLMAEAIYLFGIMLTLLDLKIEGVVRERMLVSYLRYKGPNELPLIDEVCNLCRSTGFSSSSIRRPANYPEDYFARFPIDENVVNMVIGRLRSDDIYNQIKSYPLPQHRSAALATQASIIYIILFFVPSVLKSDFSVMREIVDKHFPDNWVIPFYLGFTVDLSVAWDGYKAAKAALANTIMVPHVQELSDTAWSNVSSLIEELDLYLTEGMLEETYILDCTNKLLNCLRKCNVTLRFLLLHLKCSQKRFRDIFLNGRDREALLVLLLNTSQFEFVLKGVFEKLLSEKQQKWEYNQKEAADRMKELGEYFSGEKALTRVKQNKQLQKWFADMSGEIERVDYNDSVSAGRKISQIIHALEEVEQFQEIESSIQVKHFLIESRQFLVKMIRVVNIQNEVLVTIDLVSDIAYSWELINDYVPQMQEGVKRNPKLVLKLRSLFLKLVSILNIPLVRINQSSSPDLFSVSAYYSDELVIFLRKVLEIIPRTVFDLLSKIIDLSKSHQLVDLPWKVEKERLKDFAQLDERFILAEITHSISVFTEGVLAMESTIVGVNQVDAREVLEDGIRKELVYRLAASMDSILWFKTGKVEELSQKLEQLADTLGGYFKSFEYIQDYIRLQGLKIWQEEFSRMINFNVEQECNSFLTKKTYEWESQWQSRDIPIPVFKNSETTESVNFIGRLARELLEQTDYRKVLYLDSMSAWYDNSGKEVVGIRTFTLLMRSLGVFGLKGLDQLYCFMIVKELQNFMRFYRQSIDKNTRLFVTSLAAELHPTSTIPTQAAKLYDLSSQRMKHSSQALLDTCARVGQMQLIRRQIANTLNFSCKLDSKVLYSTLSVLNTSIIRDIEEHYRDPESKPYPNTERPLLSDLSDYLETAGIGDPLTKIYMTTTSMEGISESIFLFVISQAKKFTYNSELSTVVWIREKNSYDITSLVIGTITLLKQFHINHTHKFLAYLGQYVRAVINLSGHRDKGLDFPPEAINVLLFIELFVKYSLISKEVIESYLPPFIFNIFTH